MAEEEPPKKDEKKELRYPGGSPVMAAGIYSLVGYMLLMTVVIFVALVVLWPPIRPEGKVAAQAALEGIATPTPSPSSPAPTQTPAPTTTPGPTAPSAAGGGPAQSPTPSPTPGPAASPTPDMRGEHDRIFNGRCNDVYGKPREGVSPLNIPVVRRLGFAVKTPRCVYDEDRLLLIVLFAGALGGMIYALRSLVWYIGNRSLKWSWSALYFLTPFTSAAIALVFYFVIRGGFFSPTSSVTDTSPFGFAALAALIGMFTEQAINKLKSVAETLLTGKEQGKDHVGPAPAVTSISPANGPTSGGTSVSIVGDNFRPGVAVTFGGVAATVESVEAKLVKVTTPPHAAGKVEVVVKNDDEQQHVFKDGFEYKDETPQGTSAPAPGEPAPSATGEAASTPTTPAVSGAQPETGTAGGGE